MTKTATRATAEQRFIKHLDRMALALERLRLAHGNHLGVDPESLNWGDVTDAEELANKLESAANFIRAPQVAA